MTTDSHGKLAVNGGEPIRRRPFPPWPDFTDEEIHAVEDVLRQGRVNYWTGSCGMEFQERFAAFCGVQHGIAVMNGTAALHVALAAADVGPGDEVIVPCRTFIATSFAVLHQQAVPVFADIDLQTQNISVESIRENLGERTRAIIPVHLAGYPADMDAIMTLAAEHNLVVIEDAAQAHGAEYKGRRAGALGHIAAFSFCNDKIFTTGGEGGMVVTDDDRMAETARSVKDHGYNEIERRSLLELEALYTYVHHRIGYNYRMTEMQAAIGLKALERIDWNLQRRRENGHYLTERLQAYDALVPPHEAADVKHAFYKYYVRLRPEKLTVDRDTFVTAMRAEGVPVGLGTAGENYREEVYQKRIGYGKTSYPFESSFRPEPADYSTVSLPNARKLAEEVFVLQVHPTVERADLDDVVSAIAKVMDAYSS
jgi:dTDP-4-amino-4,6-dideoxygalactose transaminase